MRLIVWAALCCLCSTAHAQEPDILFADGIEDCSTYLDADQDRLTDCHEVLGTLTDPNLADTDDDGFSDGDEVMGPVPAVGLPQLELGKMGADPRKKTVFLEVDWSPEDASPSPYGACPKHGPGQRRPTSRRWSRRMWMRRFRLRRVRSPGSR